MSAPDINLEKQRRRHRGPLIGMVLAVLFGLGLMFFWLTGEVSDSAQNQPADPAAAAVEADPAAQTQQ